MLGLSVDSDVRIIILGLWILIGIVWLSAGLSTKRVARAQQAGSRFTHVLILLIAFLLLFDNRLNVGPLNRRFLSPGLSAQYLGLVLTGIGAAFAIWARLLLGTNWSATVTLKEDHRLIKSGPYALVRHPIYSGLLLAMLGTALAIAEYRCLLAVLVALLAWRAKWMVEEQFMSEQFGVEYSDYKRNVKAVIPFVW